MENKKRAILMGLAVFFIVAVLFLAGFVWYKNKMLRVAAGTARPNFPFFDYSQDELNKMYPQYVENTAPTIQTPEQTHAKFVEALKKSDFDEAVECCVVEDMRTKMKEMLGSVRNRGKLELMINDIRDIEQENMYNVKATYIYGGTYNGEKVANFMVFRKDINGVWLIESL